MRIAGRPPCGFPTGVVALDAGQCRNPGLGTSVCLSTAPARLTGRKALTKDR